MRERFFAESQSGFFAKVEQAVAALAEQPDHDGAEIRKSWLEADLAPLARKIFDQEAPLLALAESGDLRALEKAVNAKRLLEISLAGYSKSGADVFKAFGLAAPAPKAKKGARA
jgi:hypothetical protein